MMGGVKAISLRFTADWIQTMQQILMIEAEGHGATEDYF